MNDRKRKTEAENIHRTSNESTKSRRQQKGRNRKAVYVVEDEEARRRNTVRFL